MDALKKIYRRQERAWKNRKSLLRRTTLKHPPRVLYIGCVDARLDPIGDIGFDRGQTFIFRNIAALVRKDKRGVAAPDWRTLPGNGEIPENTSIGSMLELFLKHVPLKSGKIKHIIIAGHTDCAGLKTCQHQNFLMDDHYLPLHLKSLQPARTRIMAEAKIKGWNDGQILQALEEASVRESITNLQSYPIVQRAIKEGTLKIHGWILDTETHLILEMNPESLAFEPMATHTPKVLETYRQLRARL